LYCSYFTYAGLGELILSYEDGCDLPYSLGMFDVKKIEIYDKPGPSYTLVAYLCKPRIDIDEFESFIEILIDYDLEGSLKNIELYFPTHIKGVDHAVYVDYNHCSINKCYYRCSVNVYLESIITDLDEGIFVYQKDKEWYFYKGVYIPPDECVLPLDKFIIPILKFAFEPGESRLIFSLFCFLVFFLLNLV